MCLWKNGSFHMVFHRLSTGFSTKSGFSTDFGGFAAPFLWAVVEVVFVFGVVVVFGIRSHATAFGLFFGQISHSQILYKKNCIGGL